MGPKTVARNILLRELSTYCCRINAALESTQREMEVKCAPAVATTVCLCTG